MTTFGCSFYADNLTFKQGALESHLKSLGAIPFIKSNVPQLMMIPDTTNQFFNRTINPIFPDRKRSAGGSSGGEAALIASQCSPCGFGTDIGGSIRTPANFCGIYGFKARGNRSSLIG